jgi:hypothetical protein
MTTCSLSFDLRSRRACRLRIGLIAAIVAIPGMAHAQNPLIPAIGSATTPAIAKKQQAHNPAEKDAVQPNVVIPVTPLGFAPPAAFYLGDRLVQVSLSFLDEDNLLFTFRVPGLIAREHAAPGQPPSEERHIRALTLSLPAGKVTAEAVWVLHDYGRYLWMLKDQKFLIRDKNMLQIGDAGLHLEPFLRFPGPVGVIQLDPEQHLMLADTVEPAAVAEKSDSTKQDSEIGASSDPASRPSTASTSVIAPGHFELDQNTAKPASENLLRVLSLDTRKVMLFSRVNTAVLLPIDGEGYYEALRGSGSSWMISYEYFQGASIPLTWIESTCNPALDALSPGIVLASACTASGARHLIAISRNDDKEHCRLWDVSLPPTKVWPLLAKSSDGLRIARATLEVSHPIGTYSPLDNEDIRGQSVQVYDLATGKLQLTVPASPILDGGGNFALSPSGKRFAVLNAGAIQVFDLPPAPPFPPASSPTSAKR